MTITVKKRQEIERRIIRRLVSDALNQALLVSVFDGEKIVLRASKSLPQIMRAIMSTDEDHLMLHHAGEEHHFAWVRLVYGNDGWDVICDYTTNIEALMAGADAVAGRYEMLVG